MGSVNRGSFKLNSVTNRSKVNSSAYNKNMAFSSKQEGVKFGFKGINKNAPKVEK